jgi:outer membrane protein TolC
MLMSGLMCRLMPGVLVSLVMSACILMDCFVDFDWGGQARNLGKAFAQSVSPAPLDLDAVVDALRKRTFGTRRETLATETLDVERALLDVENDATFSLRSGLGARLVPKETGPAAKDDSKVVLVPREPEVYQSHAFTASKPLHDFGRTEAKKRILDARQKLAPFNRLLEEEALKWKAASLLLDVRTAALEVEALEAQAQNAEQKKGTLDAEYRKGLRSEADRTRAEADALRVALPLERARQSLRRATISLLAEMGLPVSGQASSFVGPAPLRRDTAGWRALLTKAAPSQLPPATTLELQRLEAERGVVQQQLAAVESESKPRLSAELGAQLPGELFPLRSSVFGQVTFAWDIPWNTVSDLEREKLARQAQALDLEGEESRQTALTRAARAEPATNALLANLELLERQRATLDKLRGLTRQRYAAGRATSVELSSLEDELLSNATETQRLQATLASTVLTLAQARGDFSLVQALLAP